MKCIGCGIKIQSTDQNAPGYVSEIHLIENGEEVYCKRCFDIIHYNKRYIPSIEEDSITSKMMNLFQKNPYDLVLVLIDALDIYGGLTKHLSKMIGKMKTIIIINKIDILPKSLKKVNLERNVLKLSEELGLNVVSVSSISSYNQGDVLKVLNKIDKLRYNSKIKKTNFNNCYVVGYASVGKSTFINTVKDLCGKNYHPITTSDQFQTTQDLIKVELNNKFYLYDTPGLINKSSFNSYLNYDSTKKLKQKKFLHVRSYQLDEAQTLFLGGLMQLDIVQGKNISVSFFIPDNLYVHRSKLSRALELKNKQRFKLLVPPFTEEELEKLEPFIEKMFEFDDNEFYDFIITGLGYIHIKGENLKIKLTIPQKIEYKLVKSIL